MASTEACKPVFGPHVSKTMFEQKWRAKFAALEKEHGPEPAIRKTSDRSSVDAYHAWWVMKCSKLFPYLLHCQQEARNIGIDLRGSGSFKTRLQQDLPCRSSLEMSILLRELMNMAMGEWKATKNGRGLVLGIWKWQQLPLERRQKMNGLLMEWQKSMDAGKWMLDDDVQAVMHEGGRKEIAENPIFRK